MRLILGLDRPTAGQALIGGRPYRRLRRPLHEIGALLDARAVHPARSRPGPPAPRWPPATASPNAGSRRSSTTVGLDERAAAKPARALSLGMGQRLGIAGALLGDPPVLMFDEPVNGLDPDGVRWIRQLTRSLAAEGRTVLISSHLMSEMQQTADWLVVLGRGRLIADAPTAQVIADSGVAVRVRSPRPEGLAAVADRLTAAGALVEPAGTGELTVTGTTAERVGELAYELGVPLHELASHEASLERAFMALTADRVEYAARPAHTGGASA